MKRYQSTSIYRVGGYHFDFGSALGYDYCVRGDRLTWWSATTPVVDGHTTVSVREVRVLTRVIAPPP